VTQNVFIKIYKNIHAFKGDSKLYTWIYRIATNESITFLKQQKRHYSEAIDETAAIYTMADDNLVDGEKVQVLLENAVAQLPEKQQLVFNMRYFEDMSYQDISEVLGTSVSGLKASYHIAVKKIEHFVKSRVLGY
jgi:RNA polymerase sigma-70 factor (ECF subfamily)